MTQAAPPTCSRHSRRQRMKPYGYQAVLVGKMCNALDCADAPERFDLNAILERAQQDVYEPELIAHILIAVHPLVPELDEDGHNLTRELSYRLMGQSMPEHMLVERLEAEEEEFGEEGESEYWGDEFEEDSYPDEDGLGFDPFDYDPDDDFLEPDDYDYDDSPPPSSTRSNRNSKKTGPDHDAGFWGGILQRTSDAVSTALKQGQQTSQQSRRETNQRGARTNDQDRGFADWMEHEGYYRGANQQPYGHTRSSGGVESSGHRVSNPPATNRASIRQQRRSVQQRPIQQSSNAPLYLGMGAAVFLGFLLLKDDGRSEHNNRSRR